MAARVEKTSLRDCLVSGYSKGILNDLWNAEAGTVNQNSLNDWQQSLSGVGRVVVWLAIAWLLGILGLGWLIKSFLVLLGLLLITPIVAFVGLRWWVQKNLVQGACPVCSAELTGFNRMELQCASCGETLQVNQGKFRRITPAGTIDVDAVDVTAQQVED
jgi:hypothetical protein